MSLNYKVRNRICPGLKFSFNTKVNRFLPTVCYKWNKVVLQWNYKHEHSLTRHTLGVGDLLVDSHNSYYIVDSINMVDTLLLYSKLKHFGFPLFRSSNVPKNILILPSMLRPFLSYGTWQTPRTVCFHGNQTPLWGTTRALWW